MRLRHFLMCKKDFMRSTVKESFRECILKYHMLDQADIVVAGVSGGADSVCLFTLLNEFRKEEGLPFALEAVHVHHGIRKEEAGRDAEFVRRLCEENGIPFHLYREDVPKKAEEWKISEEEAGRRVRYEAFRNALGIRNGMIATAHNADDRAETVLFNLFRGASLSGLSGIRPVNGNIIRPLLYVTRQEIEGFLKERGIPYVEDETNRSDDYTRNRIRHHILSYAKEEISGAAVENICRAAGLAAAAEDYLQGLANKQLEDIRQRDGSFKITLPLSDPYMGGRLIYLVLCELAGKKKDIAHVHVQSVLSLAGKGGEKNLDLPYGIGVRKTDEILHFFRKEDVPEGDELSGEPEYEISQRILEDFDRDKIPAGLYTKWFDYDKINSTLCVRKRRPGDYLCIDESLHRKALKDYLIDEKIPKSERDSLLLLADEDHILWVIGHRISEYYKVSDRTGRVLEVTVNKKERTNGGKD